MTMTMNSSIVEILRFMISPAVGYLCLGRIRRPGKGWQQEFFPYPDVLEDIDGWIHTHKDDDLYFCPHLLLSPRRKKEEAIESHIVWADLDECSPDKLGKYGEPQPNIVIQTSKSHYQAYWRLKAPRKPSTIENLNHRVYEAYKAEGCDSCWALAHMMRLPYTINRKRTIPFKMRTTVDWGCCTLKALDSKLPALIANESEEVTINVKEKPVIKIEPKHMKMYGKHLWFDPVPQGKRSERIYQLVKLAIDQLQCNDAGAIKLLMEHPVLIDKFPDEKDRFDDIVRCLMKIKTTEVINND